MSLFTPKNRIDAWTGIRGIAALWVALFHINCFNLKLDFGWLTPFIGRGELAVDMFFILSGLVISYVHQAEFKVWNTALALRFWVLRFARIYPLHLLMLLVMALLQTTEGAYSVWVLGLKPWHHLNSIQDFGLSLLNIHCWETTKTLSFNFPSWSVSAEWFAYLLFPFATLGFCRLRSWWSNLALIALSLGVLYGACALNHDQQMGYTTHLGLVRICTEFTVGCGLYNLLKLQQRHLPGMNLIALACPILIPVLILLKLHEIWIVALMALWLYVLAQVSGKVKALFTDPVLVYGGEISYAMYMVHAFMLYLVNDTALFILHKQQWNGFETFGLCLVYLMLIIAGGAWLNQAVEVPARNAIRRAWDNRKARSAKNSTEMEPA